MHITSISTYNSLYNNPKDQNLLKCHKTKDITYLSDNKFLNSFNEFGIQNYNNIKALSFKGNYATFIKKYKNIYGDTKFLSQILTSFINKTELFIGAGRDKKVYSIPKLQDYVIAHKKAYSLNVDALFHKSADIYKLGDKYNFGQPILDNGNGTFIMKRVDGISYSIGNWPEAFDRYTLKKQYPTRNEAVQFLNSLKQVSKMPQDAYYHLANQIKYLSQKGINFDLMNPNNILIDTKSGKISYIDISEGAQNYFTKIKKERPINTVTDMMAALSDSILNLQYCKSLNKEEAHSLVELTKNVLKKCKLAGEHVGLAQDKSITFDNMQTYTNYVKHRYDLPIQIPYENIYKEFADFYKI